MAPSCRVPHIVAAAAATATATNGNRGREYVGGRVGRGKGEHEPTEERRGADNGDDRTLLSQPLPPLTQQTNELRVS